MISVGKGLDDLKCIPHISQYTDCTDANACSGCTRCSCNEAGNWDCQEVLQCPREDDSYVDDMVLDNALDVLYDGLDKNRDRSPGSLGPSSPHSDEDLLLVPDKRAEMEEELRILMSRQKRSINGDSKNATVKFYGTVDEINEDTLGNSTSPGTLKAQKVDARELKKMSRRTDTLARSNTSNASALYIEYNQPHEIDRHVAENKIDSKHPTEDKINGLSHEEIHKILGNYSQIIKDKDLSKLVVNELTRGSERIGDINVVPVSNITFTPENDTLTAMTFIAGNLLNKLWDMEKDVSEGSYETEVMKREKNNDLLELFKEPLSLRQENFLRNALEQLSHALDTNENIKKISICANIEDPDTVKTDNNCTEKKMIKDKESSVVDVVMNRTRLENKSKATAKAINKIHDVLNLMNKYDHLQDKSNHMKSLHEHNHRKSVAQEENMSTDENVSLNLFGNLLDKITKLLSPNKNSKSPTKRIHAFNMLRRDDLENKNIESLFKINLKNTTLSAKDKLITDYLSNVEKHPRCVFSHLQTPVIAPISNVEGSILYNLSEFFKVKSFIDLMKIVNDKPNIAQHQTIPLATSAPHRTSTEQSTTTAKNLGMKSENETLQSAKEKLKNDIKNILQDIFDLQKERGIKTKSNVNIAEVLPCIYNMLKSNDDPPAIRSRNTIESTPTDKIRSFIDELKLDMKFLSPNRRTNINITPRPKSAIVWERAIKNLNKKYQKSSRRFISESSKSYSELIEMMDNVQFAVNAYKNVAIRSGVAPSERLILFKTLQADVKQYMNVLEAINNSLTTVVKLPTDKQNEFYEFLDNAATNINLSKKLIAFGQNFKRKTAGNIKTKLNKSTGSAQPLMMIPKWVEANTNNNFKLNRDQIMNQLIVNRLRLYIKTMERTEIDLNTNANYNIAKRILFHLENGNIALAKELYKVFLANKRHSFGDLNKSTEYHAKESLNHNEKLKYRGQKFLAFNEPLAEVEDAQKIKMLMQDYFLKQLWNLKELKE